MLVSLLMMIAGIVVSSLLFIRLQESNTQLKKVSDQLDTANQQLKFRVVRIDSTVGNKNIETIKDSIETITKLSTDKFNPVLIQREISLRAKLEYANYFVGVYSLGVTSEEFNNTVNYLNTKGYSIVTQVELNARNRWLANTSTVFYYDASTQKLAQNLADELRGGTKINFAVKMGAGAGVPDGMEKRYFYVHLVGGPEGRDIRLD